MIPTSRYAAELNWIGKEGSSHGGASQRPAALYALAYQISGDPQHLANGLRLASRRFALARCLGDEGRFHGCARGNVRTIIDEDVLPVMHSTALGLHGIAFDGNAHLQSAVAFRGTEGQCGLPETLHAAFRKAPNGRKEVHLFNAGSTDEWILIQALDNKLEPGIGKGLVSPMTLPWNTRLGLGCRVQAGTARSLPLAASEAPPTGV